MQNVYGEGGRERGRESSASETAIGKAYIFLSAELQLTHECQSH